MEFNTYLSDDEEIDIENNEMVELDRYGMPIEEIDQEEMLEIRRIVSNKLLSRNSLNEEIFCESNNGSSKKNSFKDKEYKTPKQKTMSLNDLNCIISQQIEDKKPKKFVSKRSMEKKISDPTITNAFKVVKRQFNPRMIPYLFSDEYKSKKFRDSSKIQSFDNSEFPTL